MSALVESFARCVECSRFAVLDEPDFRIGLGLDEARLGIIVSSSRGLS